MSIKALTRLLITLLTITVILSSCSTKFAYNFLDWVIQWEISKYTKLTKEQRKYTNPAIDEFHRWHRHTQLPAYADYLEGLQQRLNARTVVTGEQLHEESDTVQLMIDDSLKYFIPIAATTLSSLSDAQTEEFFANLLKERQEYTEKYISSKPQKIHKNRVNKLKDYVTPWTGRLTAEQKQWIDTWSLDLEPYAELALEQQVAWEEKLRNHMAQRQDIAALEKGLHELTFYRTDGWGEEIQKTMDINQEKTFALLAKIYNNLTDKQKKRVAKKFHNYIADFRDLAAKKTKGVKQKS